MADFWLEKETDEKGAGENCLGYGNVPPAAWVVDYTDRCIPFSKLMKLYVHL